MVRTSLLVCVVVLVAACGDAAPLPVAPAPAPVVTDSAPPKRVPVSGIDKANFDPAVRPQDDLFRVCGGAFIDTENATEDEKYFYINDRHSGLGGDPLKRYAKL